MLRYAITDASFRPGHAAHLASLGVDYLQLRAKSLSTAELLALTRTILAEIKDTPTRLLINSRADIALASHAHGVHLTSSPTELTPQQIRTLFTHTAKTCHPSPQAEDMLLAEQAPIPCISTSCHTLEDVTRAHTLGVDLILFGPVFEKRVAQQFITDGSGLHALAAAVKAAAGTPVLALGGITHENTHAWPGRRSRRHRRHPSLRLSRLNPLNEVRSSPL